MKKFLKALKPVVVCFIIMTLLCGVIYPGIVTGVSQVFFKGKANGSIITVKLKDGTKKEYGSTLIGQEFTQPKYLIGRPMGTTNLSPVSRELKNLVENRIAWWHTFDKNNTADIPMDLVTASGSGVDPNISPEAAQYQVSRIARERSINEDAIQKIIIKYTKERFLGFWGEPSVNVLKVNLALDGLI